MEELPVGKVVAVALLAVLVIALTSCGVEIVDQGNTGVKKVMGKVDSDGLPAGLYFTNPLTTSIIEVDNRVQRMEGTTPVYTKDVQQANVTFVLNYALKPAATVDIYSTVGTDWAEKLIPQIVNGSMKNVIGKWNAIDLVSNREKASQEIEASIRAALESNGVVISKLELTNIDYENAFEQSVEAKVIAVQQAEESKNRTVRVEEEAKQRVIAAEADAKAMQIKTDALKQSQDLIMYEAVQKWNGVLPQYLLGDAVPLMNMGAR